MFTKAESDVIKALLKYLDHKIGTDELYGRWHDLYQR